MPTTPALTYSMSRAGISLTGIMYAQFRRGFIIPMFCTCLTTGSFEPVYMTYLTRSFRRAFTGRGSAEAVRSHRHPSVRRIP